MRNNLAICALFVGTALTVTSCNERQQNKVETQADKAADKMSNAADKAVDKMEHAADKAGDKMSEAATTTSVKSKIAADVKLSTITSINVDTNGHVVTLTGTVPTAADRASAVAVAKSVDGVTAVVNNLMVKP